MANDTTIRLGYFPNLATSGAGSLYIQLEAPDGTVAGTRVRPDGVAERSPLPSDIATVTIPDLYARAASDQTVATGLAAFTAAVVEVGKAQGVL